MFFKKENIFYLISVFTILVIRVWVFLFPLRKIIIFGILIHHFWIGIIIILFVLLLPRKYLGLKEILFPIGLGVAVDELIYMILGGGTVKDYWSPYSVSGVIIMMAIIFIFRDSIAKKMYENNN